MITRTEFNGFARSSARFTRMSEAEEAAQEQAETATETAETTQPTETGTTTSTAETSSGTGFEASLKAFLATFAGQEVSEEELFAGVVKERLQALKGDEVASQYASTFEAEVASLRRADGYVGYEDAAKNALRALVNSGTLTAEEGDAVYSESFGAAQIDQRADALFDDRGGPNDPTIAATDVQSAVTSAATAIAAYTAGQASPARALSESTPGKAAFVDTASSEAHGTSSGATEHSSEAPSEQFLFKPVSDTTGKLVVLTPASWAGEIDSLTLLDAEGNTLEEGRFAGNANGQRDHFRFDKPGGRYPAGLTVEVRLSNGDIRTFTIDDPSERFEE